MTPGRPVNGSINSRGTQARRPAPGNHNGGPSGGQMNRPGGNHGGKMAPVGHRDRHHGPRVHPRDRGFIEHGHPGHFYSHHRPHYYGYRIHHLPSHYRLYRYWGWDYYLCDGIYYRWYGGYYHVCRPPFGVYFDRMLYDLDLVMLNFAYYNTLYRTYDAIDDNYRTIEEQNRIIAQNNAAIAQQNSAMASGQAMADESYNLARSLGLVQSYADANVKYYYDDGVFFILGADGQYQTIVPPAGAIIDQLPEDYEIVVLGGAEYYRVDNTIFRMVVIEGKACFEVLGQQVQ